MTRVREGIRGSPNRWVRACLILVLVVIVGLLAILSPAGGAIGTAVAVAAPVGMLLFQVMSWIESGGASKQ